MDPLTALRRHLQSGQRDVAVEGDTVVLGDLRFHKDEETAFRKNRTENEYYTLMEVLFFSMNTHLGPSDYAREAMAKQIGRVHYLDQQDMKKYLLGEVEECEKVNKTKMSQYKRKSTGEAPKEKIRRVSAPAPPTAPVVVSLSAEEVSAHRRQHAALLDEFMQAQSRGSVTSGFAESKVDPEFLEADRQELSSIRAREVHISTRNSAMHKEGANLAEETLRWYEESVKKQVAKAPAQPSAPAAAAAAPGKPVKRTRDEKAEVEPAKRRPKGYPIIIVPNALTGVLSSINARDLLQDSTYIPITVKKEQGARREPKFRITRTKDGQQLQYEVVDEGQKLTDHEWERVVAVFASGEQWQFKKWKWAEPVELFQHVLGLHIMFDGEPRKPTISSWNVRVIKVSKTRRHLDSIAFNDIWREIDNWMQLNCAWLLQQAAVAESK